MAYAILTESALSYLGLGVQPPVPSWGNMLSGARGYLWNAPHLAFYPGLLILVTVLAYSTAEFPYQHPRPQPSLSPRWPG